MIRALICSGFVLLAACSSGFNEPLSAMAPPSAPSAQEDGAVVRGTAFVRVSSAPATQVAMLSASSTASTTVTYTNARNVIFEIDARALVPGLMSGQSLSLGHVAVTELYDNDLRICGANGNQKCTTAELRVYTTGATVGFVNVSETPNYGVPVFVSGLHPNVALTLNAPGVPVQQVAGMPANKRVLRLGDFPNARFEVTSDFTEAGAGSYEMNFIIEYILKP